jgi:adenine deaminase
VEQFEIVPRGTKNSTMKSTVQGNLVDIHSRSIYSVAIEISEGRIVRIEKIDSIEDSYIIPGFIDAHIHIESSLLLPYNFAREALRHGTIATVSDPHEIANVCGLAGVIYMIENGEKSSLKFFWTAPSCVPATAFETSGAVIGVDGVEEMLKWKQIVALGEMMNYPGVIFDDQSVLRKCEVAKISGKVIDGHAPGLTGKELSKYIAVGISTDHECDTLNEALEKIQKGMKILIREGSSAKNFEELFPLLLLYPENVMLCSDDLHADDLLKGHINLLIKRALKRGANLFDVLSAVSRNPVEHYNLPVGLLRVGDPADFLIVDNLENFRIMSTWINGKEIKNEGPMSESRPEVINNFNCSVVSPEDLKIEKIGNNIRVIGVEDGSILTKLLTFTMNGEPEVFLNRNRIHRLVVKNRYNNHSVSNALVHGFGPMMGAVAASIAHDSHNIIALGDELGDISKVINLLVESKGGIAFVNSRTGISEVLNLPVAGLMSDLSAQEVAGKYEKILKVVREHGCSLKSPLMTLSFLALLVIPSLKLSDKGLFDVDKFCFTDLFFE